MDESVIRRCGWAVWFGFALTFWFGMMLGTPTGVWLRLLSHFVSTAVLFVVLTTFLERGSPVALCIAAYGALLAVSWGTVARVLRFAELRGELQPFPATSHFHLPSGWWQSPWFWPGPIFIGLLIMTIALLLVLFNPRT